MGFSCTISVAGLLYLLQTAALAQAISVTACGADPSGHRDSTSSFQDCLKKQASGDIVVPYGTYRITSSIFKNRNQNIIGMGSKASLLRCEAPDAPCIVAADTAGGANNYANSSIHNLGLEGPGSASHSTGILIGGDPQARRISKSAFGDSVDIVDVRVAAFGHGVEWGNNAWGNKIVRCLLFENAVGLFVPTNVQNSGEAISVTDSNVFNNRTAGIEDHGNFEWMIQGTSFDYNAIAITFYGATVHVMNCHFEQPTAKIFFQPYGMANLSIRDSEMLIQAAEGQDRYILDVWPQALNLSVDDVSIWSNHPVQYFMRVQGSVTGTISNLHGNGNRKIVALADAKGEAAVSANSAF